MIRFFDVTKTRYDVNLKKTRFDTILGKKKIDARALSEAIVLKDCTAALDVSNFSSIEHADADVASTFLQLVYGSVKPDRGRVINGGVRVSPVIALGGRADLLIPTLTVRENIQFQARLSHIDANLFARQIIPMFELFRETLAASAPRLTLPQAAALLDTPLNGLAFPARRLIEFGIFTTIPYDCYLIDRLELIPDFAQKYAFESARSRSAGIFFATSRIPLAKRFCDLGIAIANGRIEFYRN